VASFPQVSPPTPCTQLSPPPYALHAPPISFFLILSPAQYWVRSTDHSAPHYVIFSMTQRFYMSKYNNPYLNLMLAAKTSFSRIQLRNISIHTFYSEGPPSPPPPLEHNDILLDLQSGELARRKKRTCHRNIITGVSVRPLNEKERENICIPMLGFEHGSSLTRIRVTSIPQSRSVYLVALVTLK
jgi:hypothetical protein